MRACPTDRVTEHRAREHSTGAERRRFTVHSDFAPAGDQPAAIAALAEGITRGDRFQTLLGITGSGKSATVAWTVQEVQKPTLILAPNKSLAAQLATEMKEFFPENRVEYFVSYYDYYQPEAYMAASDTYIEKDSSINDDIDRLRHSATAALLTRRDTIVVASVSCIYGMGDPAEYRGQLLELHTGVDYDQRSILRRLVDLQYDRNDLTLGRGKFRVRGDTIEVHPAYDETVLRIEMFGETVERLTIVDPLTGEQLNELSEVIVFPATHYVAGDERMRRAVLGIEAELQERLAFFEREGKLLEAQRLRMRTQYDLEMIQEVGYCNGIENYSMHIDGRSPGEPPFTLLDYFPDDYLLVMDESHQSVPQLHGQYEGDRSRKDQLVEHGFRLPSARDNRPLRFEEVMERINQCLFLSATPSPYELRVSDQVVEQIVRPTGLVDPEVIVKPTKGQIDDLIELVGDRVTKGDRVLVTTLTKKMAEDLTEYLLEQGLRVRYLHSNVDTIQRIEILRALRLGEFDVLVGINLLREGLDLPEVSLVAILDADKEGFLRSQTSLIQTMGRAARNVDGQVVMYADRMTDSMQQAIDITNRRREAQVAYNAEHGINPQTIRKAVTDILSMLRPDETAPVPGKDRRRQRERDKVRRDLAELPQTELVRLIQTLEEEMHEAAAELRFEYAARLRDEVNELAPRAARVGLDVGDRSARSRRPRAQPQEHQRRAPSGEAHRVHRPVGLGQVVAGLRHHLRGGPASLRRVAQRLRAPVPGPDGQARRRLHRGAVAGHLDRPEVGVAQPPLHGRHHHRGLRLPAPAVGPHRDPALPGARRPPGAPEPAADRGPPGRAARGHPVPGPGAGGPGPQGRVRDAPPGPVGPGLRAGPDRRRHRRDLRVPQGRRSAGPLRAAHHRGGGGPAGPSRRDRAAADRLGGDRAEAGRGRGRDRGRSARRRAAGGDAHLQPAPGVPGGRRVLRGAGAPQLLVQLALRRLRRSATAWAPRSRSIPSWSSPTRTCRWARVPSPRGARPARSTSAGCWRPWRRPTTSTWPSRGAS